MNIGGLDIGTTGCKLTVYQTDGTHLCTAYRAYDEMPDYAAKKTDPGLLHAGIIYEAVGEVIRETVKKTTVDAIGVTSFGETFVLLDADDRILLPSILYADARGVEECAVFAERHTEQITGVAPGYLFSLPARRRLTIRWRPEPWGLISVKSAGVRPCLILPAWKRRKCQSRFPPAPLREKAISLDSPAR